jgi:acetolactate synthase-1/2/3 large subunit
MSETTAPMWADEEGRTLEGLSVEGSDQGPDAVEGHTGAHAVAVAAAHGVDTMFTLSGAHVFPMYDGAVKADPPMRLLDVRHEQTAVFAAEAVGKLTRTPGLAVLTAGPGVTNGVSAITQAYFSGAPLVVVGGRAPDNRWGTGSLQELDHVPLVAPVTKSARTVHRPVEIGVEMDRAFTLARSSHRGPTFLDVPMDALFETRTVTRPSYTPTARVEPDPDSLSEVGALLAEAARPVLVIGGDVWADGAEAAALRLVEEAGLPAITNGMGRGVVPAGHPLLVTKARSRALGTADLVVAVGTPLDFRLSYGSFGGKDGASPARVVHLADTPAEVSAHADLAASAGGDLTAVLDGVLDGLVQQLRRPDWSHWVAELGSAVAAAAERDRALMAAQADPIHPARIYGELLPRLADDAVVIGDGGDFVSFAGKLVEPVRPGGWLDPGPYGCLGAGLGAAIAARLVRPSSQVVLLLGDGAAGLSLMDVDTLVRHDLPVVMVCGNNSAWALEKRPMQMLYGYDVIADLAPQTRYDEVARALGGGGELVTDPAGIGPALDRAFASGVPYLVNVITDVRAAYPRSTFGI